MTVKEVIQEIHSHSNHPCLYFYKGIEITDDIYEKYGNCEIKNYSIDISTILTNWLIIDIW